MGIRSMENFNIVPNIDHKRKGYGVGSRGVKGWWPKQVTTARVGSIGGGEGSAGSKDGEETWRVAVNSLIIRVILREIVIWSLGASMQTLSLMAILNGLEQ